MEIVFMKLKNKYQTFLQHTIKINSLSYSTKLSLHKRYIA